MKNSPAKRLGIFRKLAYGLLATVLFFTLLELMLMAIGFRKVTDDHDPLVGFSKNSPLFEVVRSEQGRAVARTRESKLVWFNAEQFSKQKQDGTCRVVCLGGSTTYGRPYSDSTSFAGWLRELLPIVDPDKGWEVINAGGVSYASYRVVNVMQEMLGYDPDLFVIYTGHNEFLEDRTYAGLKQRAGLINDLQAAVIGTRTYALVDRVVPLAWHNSELESRDLLPSEVNERLNHTIGPSDYQRDPQWSSHVVQHYHLNLERMVRIARKAKVDIVFVTPAANEKDFSPFKSEPASPAELSLIADSEAKQSPSLLSNRASLEKAVELEREGKLQEAIECLQQATVQDPWDANLQYQLGRLQFAAGDYPAARTSFQAAIDQDVCPLRATSAIHAALREVCDSLGVSCVDFQERLRRKSEEEFGYELLGDEYFLDHVHPNIDTHFELAKWIIETLQQDGIVKHPDLKERDLGQVQSDIAACRDQVLGRLDEYQHGVALRNLAKVLHWSGKFRLAADRASDALELLGSDPESRFILADCLKNTGELERSRIQYELLLADHPGYGRAYLPLGQVLLALGEADAGLAFLLDAVAFDPDSAYAYAELGKYYLQQREWKLAAEALLAATRLNPEDRQSQLMLDMCRQALGIAGYPTMQ